MSEWWTYSLSDMLLFSPRVYYRLFELHNHSLWPAQLLTVAAGLGMVFALARPSILLSRATFVVLGALWIWIAWAFFWERYATINWAAPYITPAYVLEGLMLIATGLLRNQFSFSPAATFSRNAAIVLLMAILIGYPLIAPAVGRSWSSAEVFGIAPDPTALATLAVLAASPKGGRLAADGHTSALDRHQHGDAMDTAVARILDRSSRCRSCFGHRVPEGRTATFRSMKNRHRTAIARLKPRA